MTAAVQKAPRFTTDDAARLAAEYFGLLATVEPLPSERDQNFLMYNDSGARFVFKIANADEALEVLDLQNKALKFLAGAQTGLQWPLVIPSRSGNDVVPVASPDGTAYFVRLFRWVDGVCLATIKPRAPELLESLGSGLARIAAALSHFVHPAARRTLYWDLRHAPMARVHIELLSAHQRELVEPIFAAWNELDWGALRSSTIHGDPNDYNILTDANGSRVVSVLDLGDMVHTATVCDLAIALAYIMLGERDPIAAAAHVVAAYHDIRALTLPEVEAVYTLAATRLAMSVCYAACQAACAPDNDYLNISNAPAWALLEKLSALPAGWPTDVFRRACAFPGPTSTDLLRSRRLHLGPSLSIAYQQPLHIIRGWKQCLYDSSGHAYLDCVNNVSHVGHCHPRVVHAAASQMALLNTNTRYLHENLSEYIERLTATLPASLSVVYLVSSGSEANELALRLARARTRRDGFIVVDMAYHGNTNALIDISPYKFNGPGGRGKPPHVQVVPIPWPGDTTAATYVAKAARESDNIAAFICESALSCAGQVILPPGYLKEAYSAVRAVGGVCIADEVQTGFGRAGSHFWMFETQRVIPDIVTLGKPIGNGHPLGAVITTPEIANTFANGMEYFNTFGGNPVSCAAGLAVLDVLRDEGLQENARDTGAYLLEAITALTERHSLIGEVRGQGLFLGFEVLHNPKMRSAGDTAADVVNRMKDLGVLLSTDGAYHNVIKIKPPMVFSRADADLLIESLDSVLE